jgi:hypothetical protein
MSRGFLSLDLLKMSIGVNPYFFFFFKKKEKKRKEKKIATIQLRVVQPPPFGH